MTMMNEPLKKCCAQCTITAGCRIAVECCNAEDDNVLLREKIQGLELQIGRLRAALDAAPEAYRCEDCFSHLPRDSWEKAWSIIQAAEKEEKRVDDFTSLNERQAREGVSAVRKDLEALKRVEPSLCPHGNIHQKGLGRCSDCAEENARHGLTGE